jgi:carboxymethylenebutenolidase
MTESILFFGFCITLVTLVIFAKKSQKIDNFLFYSSIILVSISMLIYYIFKNPEMFFKIDNFQTIQKNNVVSENVTYFENYKGFYAYPEKEGDYPGIIMIHEWWGLNDHIKEKAKDLASEGYNVLAVDLFGSVATTPEDARKQSSGLDQEKAILNLKAAKQFLTEKNSKKIASLGWCFGGAQSLQISVNEKLDATVIYYGNVSLPKEKLKNISNPVLGIFGDQDNLIPINQVNEFEKNLSDLNISNSINIYKGVGHAFANPSNPNYSVAETEDAWDKTLQFLSETLK